MKILAIDVGTGTEDILLYDTEKEIENEPKHKNRFSVLGRLYEI